MYSGLGLLATLLVMGGELNYGGTLTMDLGGNKKGRRTGSLSARKGLLHYQGCRPLGESQNKKGTRGT